MTQYGTWIAYDELGSIIVALILLAITVLLYFCGVKLKHPIKNNPPGKFQLFIMLLIWILSILTFINNVFVYIIQLVQKSMIGFPPFNPVSYVTFPAVFITFIIIFLLTRKSGLLVAVGNAFIGAIAATMIFEFPFDIIIISQTYPPIPPSPLLYRGVFFLPLFLIEVTTLSLLLFSPIITFTKFTFFSLAGMIFIFALWAIFGFAYPTNPLLLLFNIASKILAFITAITLFIPQGVLENLRVTSNKK